MAHATSDEQVIAFLLLRSNMAMGVRPKTQTTYLEHKLFGLVLSSCFALYFGGGTSPGGHQSLSIIAFGVSDQNQSVLVHYHHHGNKK